MTPGSDEETAIKVSVNLPAQLKAPNVTYLQAEVKPANWFERLRYDNSARLTAGAATLGVIAGVWGIVEAAAGSDAGWMGIVGGVIGMLVALTSSLRSA